ncbi:proteasome subunit beta type-7-like [Sitodiplosis mosellana]|nr:proteasome subunit beta type-7-like [Sitodiplosis mosellana]
MGSGSLAAMAVFEDRWRPDMEEEEAKKLVRDAIASGVFNDLGSGSNIDLCVIKKGTVEYLRGYEYANEKGVRALNYDFKLGTTAVLDTKIHQFDIEETVIPIASSSATPMDTA